MAVSEPFISPLLRSRPRERAQILRNFDIGERTTELDTKSLQTKPLAESSDTKSLETNLPHPRPLGDEVLDRLGGSFEAMSDEQFVYYFKARYEKTHGVSYTVAGELKKKYVTVMRSFRGRYGPDAGLMMQVFFDEWGGKVRDETYGIEAFTVGNDWLQKRLLVAVQKRRIKQRKAQQPKRLFASAMEWVNEYG